MRTWHLLLLILAFWLGGGIAGYYVGANWCMKKTPTKARYSYVDTVPPPCVFQPTRDQRHVCEWERVQQPPMQAVKQPRGGRDEQTAQ